VEISVSQEQGRVPVTVLRVKGAITTYEELEAAARAAFDAGARNMLLDLHDVPYIATSGLRALHIIYTLLRTDSPDESDEAVKRGISAGTFYSPHLKLLSPSAHVMQALKVAGYDMFLEIHRDHKQAVNSF
jgi:anti-anti-sigma regulatory factor